MKFSPGHRVHLECDGGHHAGQTETSRHGLQGLLVGHCLQLSVSIDELELQDEVGECLGGEAAPVTDHGVAAAVSDHHGYDVGRQGPAGLVAPVQHLQVGHRAANFHLGVLPVLQLPHHGDITQLRAPVSQGSLQSIYTSENIQKYFCQRFQ